MRKAQKKQAEDFTELLGQAHDEIKKAIEKKDIPSALSLLADCQNGAISLGELIEKTEGEGAATVSILENYCERIFQIHENLCAAQEEETKGLSVNVNKIYKVLRQCLIKIENSIRNDIKVRQEVVFLPYKASMWDSLESVWKAADEDPDCDAYVIPIPYYDKKPDGSFGEMHYEAGQYPEYVPVLSYVDYDFEKRRPDMIYIHNPYDDCNIVTSVMPFFYSKNLKQFTDKLIYIPYFVLGEIKPDDRQAVEGVEKFCLVPGVMNADKVVVQSEDMRQVYINVLTKASGEDTRSYWEKKILGLGSPKVDKVLSTKKEDLEIPEEWLRIIRKPDGSWKKIVFYNTSVTALLEHNEKMLEKMQDVFRVFYENRDEVALLWRPHPLIQATIKSMRPQLWKEYKKILYKYIKTGWGIYDDTANVDRAVMLSDAYYGDPSSVTQLYQGTGKPVMRQECRILCQKRNDRWHPQIVKSLYFKDELFFSAGNYNGFFSINLTTGKVVLCGNFSGERIDTFYLSSNYILRQNVIMICPCLAKNTYVYQYQKQSMAELGIERLKNQSFLMYQVEGEENDGLYFVPTSGRKFGKIKKNINKIEYEIDFMERYIREVGEKYKTGCDSGIYIYKGYMYFATFEQNFLVKVNLSMHLMSFIKISDIQGGFYKVLGMKNHLYMLNNENEVIIYDLDMEEVISILRSKKLDIDKGLYRDGFEVNGCFYFVSYLSNKCIKIGWMSDEIRCTTLEEEWGIDKEEGEEYHFTCIYEEKWLFVVSNKNHLVQINLQSGRYKKITLEFDMESIKKTLDREIKKHISNDVLINESDNLYDLSDLLSSFVEYKSEREGTKQMLLVGKKIISEIQY